jgi:sirohydrochlorin ferrochelatase
LLVAHGERREGAGNEGLVRLTARLSAKGAADEISYALIKGAPTIAEALAALREREILVYPFLTSAGWFARVRLPRLLAEAVNAGAAMRRLRLLPPLGLDAGLPALAAEKAAYVARRRACDPADATVVVLAHGSPEDRGARAAPERLGRRIHALGRFAGVRIALLEEVPSLADTLAEIAGPAIVVGLFAGEGLHGARDVPRLIDALARADVDFAGHVGTWPETAELVAAAIERAESARASAPERET